MARTLFLDFETSDQKKGKKRDPSPYDPNNYLVSYGYRTSGIPETCGYHFLRHDQFSCDSRPSVELLQKLLFETDLLVAFNAKFELSWLLEAGFKYDGPIYDPMVVEYILARGQDVELSLDACCKRRGTLEKLGSLVEEYWDQGLSFNQMPIEVVEEYGRRDVDALYGLWFAQQQILQEPENVGLLPTIQMSHEFLICLVEMERNGIAIDRDELSFVRKQFTDEYVSLRNELEAMAQDAMGDTHINLSSPEQLSWLIYSRKVKDKKKWADIFNIGTGLNGKPKRRPRMSNSQFVRHIREQTEVLHRTRAVHCDDCGGRGLSYKVRKDGSLFKKPTKCKHCEGAGYRLVSTGKLAGFKCIPRGPLDVGAGGFATDKDTIAELVNGISRNAKNAGGTAHLFLSKLSRLNALKTYISTFIEGIERGIGQDGILHTKLNQTITATGRLSSSDPNFQNMPRARTFPVRRVVRSRFDGGSICEVDFAQLEFRVAALMASDQQAIQDILDRIDAHANTAKALTEGGQTTDRQGAKPHTFKPFVIQRLHAGMCG